LVDGAEIHSIKAITCVDGTEGCDYTLFRRIGLAKALDQMGKSEKLTLDAKSQSLTWSGLGLETCIALFSPTDLFGEKRHPPNY
jgi:hypothetical protein